MHAREKIHRKERGGEGEVKEDGGDRGDEETRSLFSNKLCRPSGLSTSIK